MRCMCVYSFIGTLQLFIFLLPSAVFMNSSQIISVVNVAPTAGF